jgi:AraC family transcriptional regulator, transcriptional activator FtrA
MDITPRVAEMTSAIDFLPTLRQSGHMLENVAVLVLDGVAPFELGVLCEVFGTDRSAQGLPRYDFAICSPGARPVTTSVGFGLSPTDDLDRLDQADLVGIPAMGTAVDVPAEVTAAVKRAIDRGAWVVTVCSGIFVLQRSGLLDGRRCTTHWMHVDELTAACPTAEVDPDVLYVQDGRLVTSAGSAAGIDACMHILRAEHGTRVANAVARRMVIPPHREGGQRQYVETPVASATCETLAPLLSWILEHLHEPLTVELLAARSHTSPRTFARRFRAETGTTPYSWLTSQRLMLAERLLEDGDDPVELVAERAGFGSAAVLRHHFAQHRRTTPQSYRRAFHRTVAS